MNSLLNCLNVSDVGSFKSSVNVTSENVDVPRIDSLIVFSDVSVFSVSIWETVM